MIHATLGIIADAEVDGADAKGLEATLASGKDFRDKVVIMTPSLELYKTVENRVDQLIICPPHKPDWVNPAVFARSVFPWTLLVRSGEVLHPDFIHGLSRMLEEAQGKSVSVLFLWTEDGFQPRLYNKLGPQGQNGKMSIKVPFLITQTEEGTIS